MSVVDAAADEFAAADAELRVTPAVVAFRTHLFGLLEDELQRARGRGDSSPETERALKHLVSVLVHTPSTRARELARAGEPDRFVEAVQTLFGLEIEAPTESAAAVCPVDHAADAS